MANFHVGSTIICSIEVRKAGALYSPATSMNIIIDRTYPNYTTVVSSTGMTPGTTGKYSYNYNTSSAVTGEYLIKYIATDGAVISKSQDTFILV